jgi:hypothetical protein
MDTMLSSPGMHHSPARAGSRWAPFGLHSSRQDFPDWDLVWHDEGVGGAEDGTARATTLEAMLSIDELATLRPRQFDIVSPSFSPVSLV